MATHTGTRAGGGPRGLVHRVHRALALSGVMAMVVCGAGASRAAAAEPGVNLSVPSPGQIAYVNALGTHWVRLFVSWRELQPTRAPIVQSDFTSYEQAFRSMPAGTKVILDVYGTPKWESGSTNERTPPANPHAFAAFVGLLARRFGGLVAAYEIWNEENTSFWWPAGPDPAAYTSLLQATYPAVKAAEPNATVLLGGLAGNDYNFLSSVYAAGGRGYFDAVGVHTDTACDDTSPYLYGREGDGRMWPDSFLAYREVHRVMLANGDEKPIWMTEMSWRTTTAVCGEGAWKGDKPEGVTDAQQALYLDQAYHCLAQDPYVQVALWFPLSDQGYIHSGLVKADGTLKPAFQAMQEYARYGDRLTEPCGVFTGPTITVASPTSQDSYEGFLPIDVSASSPLGVFRIKLEIDGKLIRNFDDQSFPPSLTGQTDWEGGKYLSPGWHTLTFIAYDKVLNTSTISVRFFHGRQGSSSSPSGHGHGHGHGHRHGHKAKRARHKHRR